MSWRTNYSQRFELDSEEQSTEDGFVVVADSAKAGEAASIESVDDTTVLRFELPAKVHGGLSLRLPLPPGATQLIITLNQRQLFERSFTDVAAKTVFLCLLSIFDLNRGAENTLSIRVNGDGAPMSVGSVRLSQVGSLYSLPPQQNERALPASAWQQTNYCF